MNAEDETNITDIDLLPDGRICVFGTSVEVLEVLDRLQCGADDAINARLDSMRPAHGDKPRPIAAILLEECNG
jgi:hypothetical protein